MRKKRCLPVSVNATDKRSSAEMKPALPARWREQTVPISGLDIPPIDPDTTIPGRFNGKTLLVTGGARGMGGAVAVRAGREGANVVIADWLAKEGEETAEEIRRNGGKAIFVRTDVSNTKDTYAMVKAAVEKFGSLDLAVNAAGVIDGVYSGCGVDLDAQEQYLFRRIHEATDQYFNRVIAINAGGVFKSLRAELAQMVKQGRGGAIVTIGSSTAFAAQSSIPAYVSSKHAVSGLVRSAAMDYAKYGIRVNSVNMANTNTSLVRRFRDILTERAKRGEGDQMVLLKTMSLLQNADSGKRMATVWEQAALILFLLSHEASGITGSTMVTDGGYTAY